jgi:hypothetical protein
MTNATVEANARVLPETTDRRGFLRSVVAAGASITASAPLALTSSPAAAAVGNVPAETEENRDLIDLARRASELFRERDRAVADLRATRNKFKETAPLPPRPRKKPDGLNLPLFKIVRNPGPLVSGKPIEISVDRAYDMWLQAAGDGRSCEPELTRKEILRVSDRYVWKLLDGAHESGYMAASRRLRELDNEIRQQAGKVFEFEPKSSLGVAAQASTLLVAFDIDARAHKEFAQRLAGSAIRVSLEQEART